MVSEEKRNRKKAMKFILLTVVFGVVFFFWGIPAVGKFAAFISDLAKSDKPIGQTDITPPAPPQIETLPEFTNQENLKVVGKSEEGVEIKLTFNGQEYSIIADSNGSFEKNVNLNEGKNVIFATATDSSGNTSQPTKNYEIVFDGESPDITIDSPSDGTSFFGSKQRQIDIKGKISDKEADVYINDRFISIDSEGTFQYTTTLNEGENKFNIKAIDKAGNQTETSLTFFFSP